MKKPFSLSVALLGVVALTPMFAFAQNAQGVLSVILELMNTVMTLLIIAATLFFIYNVVMYILGKGEQGKIWTGLLGLFIIVAFWGVIKIVQNTFGLSGNNQIDQETIPCIEGFPVNQGGC